MSDTNGFGHNRVHSSEIEDTIVAQNNGREQFEEDDLDEEGSVVSSIVDRFGFAGGENESSIKKTTEEDIEIIRRRENKWLHMLDHWDKYMLEKYKKVRHRCRKGIPHSIRPRAWLHLCGAKYRMSRQPGGFEQYVHEPGEQKWIDDIQKDLHRNFPNHEMFGGTYERIGQNELFKVLKAYTVHNPTEGYCQAQAPIAAALLMNMPATEAFWCLVCICENYIPGYYAAGMEAIQVEGDVLFGLLKKVAPGLHKHLKKQGIEPILFMTEWFLCLFTRTLPWPCVMRIWDMFFFEGVKILFRVGLVLLKAALPKRVRSQCPSMFETLEVLKGGLPPGLKDEDFLVQEIMRLDITDDDMRRENAKQVLKRKAAKNNQQQQSATPK